MSRICRSVIVMQISCLLVLPLLCVSTAAAQPVSQPASSAPAQPASRELGQPAAGEPGRVIAAAPTIEFRLSAGTVNFGGGTLEPRSSLYTDTLGATVNANMPWRISVSKDRDLTSASGVIPSENLTFAVSGPAGKTTYAAATGTQFGTNVRVVEGTRGSYLVTTITYRLNLPWTLAPDTYSATHMYTAMLI